MSRDALDLFQEAVEEHSSNKNIQNHLIELIESLYKDLEQRTRTVESLQKQLQSLINQETFGITSKYFTLKEQYSALKNEVGEFRNEITDLHTQIIAKDEETKKLLLDKEEEVQSNYTKQIKLLEEQIKRKEDELELAKLNHQKKEEELYNEIQAGEASSALQMDQIELNFRKQLADVNKKLKETTDTCNVLRNELFRKSEQLNESQSRNVELQTQLRERQNFYREKTWNNEVADTLPVIEKNTYTKYQPLEINHKNIPTFSNKSPTYKKTPVYRSGAKFTNEIPKKNNNVPPLMQLKDVNETRSNKKKRKLFNPEDLAYLDTDDDDSK